MAHLEIEIVGLHFRNPVLPAAGPPGWSGAALTACAAGGAGGLVAKTVSVEAARVPTPNMAAIPGGFLNTELWSELPVERWIEQDYAQARSTGLPLIISLGYTALEIAELAHRVRPFADALELSTHYIGDDPRPMVEAVQAAKEATDVPVLVKLSPSRDIKAAAQAAEEAGADGIVAINSFGPCFGVDIETGNPLMGSQEGYGWLSGPMLHPLALRCVFDLARTTSLPIFGVGGISRGQDAIAMFMVGAWAVQICTAAILHGPSIFGKVSREIASWLDARGHDAPEAIRGLTIRRWREHTFRTRHVPPDLDEDLCTACMLCEKSCVYGAIRVEERPGTFDASGKPRRVAVLDEARCYGCGLCVTRCKPDALRMFY